tara:strand:- start:221 stop:2062 length:1842 start_codon:yes stop_codon:yes gene_type:complete
MGCGSSSQKNSQKSSQKAVDTILFFNGIDVYWVLWTKDKFTDNRLPTIECNRSLNKIDKTIIKLYESLIGTTAKKDHHEEEWQPFEDSLRIAQEKHSMEPAVYPTPNLIISDKAENFHRAAIFREKYHDNTRKKSSSDDTKVLPYSPSETEPSATVDIVNEEPFDTWTTPSVSKHLLAMKELPPWNKRKLRQFFRQYDWSDNGSGLDEDELLQWMIEVNQVEDDRPTEENAKEIIDLHDTNKNEMMQYKEMEVWFERESKLTNQERIYLSKQSDVARRAIRFMEFMVRACVDSTFKTKAQIKEEKEAATKLQALARGNKGRKDVEKKMDLLEGKDLPRLNIKNLKKYFARYNTASSGDGKEEAIDDEELLAWMQDINGRFDDQPTIDDARNIINIYDKDGDNELQFEELEMWLDNASELTKDERIAMSLSGDAFHQMVDFVENALRACDEGGPPPLTEEQLQVIEANNQLREQKVQRLLDMKHRLEAGEEEDAAERKEIELKELEKKVEARRQATKTNKKNSVGGGASGGASHAGGASKDEPVEEKKEEKERSPSSRNKHVIEAVPPPIPSRKKKLVTKSKSEEDKARMNRIGTSTRKTKSNKESRSPRQLEL